MEKEQYIIPWSIFWRLLALSVSIAIPVSIFERVMISVGLSGDEAFLLLIPSTSLFFYVSSIAFLIGAGLAHFFKPLNTQYPIHAIILIFGASALGLIFWSHPIIWVIGAIVIYICLGYLFTQLCRQISLYFPYLSIRKIAAFSLILYHYKAAETIGVIFLDFWSPTSWYYDGDFLTVQYPSFVFIGLCSVISWWLLQQIQKDSNSADAPASSIIKEVPAWLLCFFISINIAAIYLCEISPELLLAADFSYTTRIAKTILSLLVFIFIVMQYRSPYSEPFCIPKLLVILSTANLFFFVLPILIPPSSNNLVPYIQVIHSSIVYSLLIPLSMALLTHRYFLQATFWIGLVVSTSYCGYALFFSPAWDNNFITFGIFILLGAINIGIYQNSTIFESTFHLNEAAFELEEQQNEDDVIDHLIED